MEKRTVIAIPLDPTEFIIQREVKGFKGRSDLLCVASTILMGLLTIAFIVHTQNKYIIVPPAPLPQCPPKCPQKIPEPSPSRQTCPGAQSEVTVMLSAMASLFSEVGSAVQVATREKAVCSCNSNSPGGGMTIFGINNNNYYGNFQEPQRKENKVQELFTKVLNEAVSKCHKELATAEATDNISLQLTIGRRITSMEGTLRHLQTAEIPYMPERIKQKLQDMVNTEDTDLSFVDC